MGKLARLAVAVLGLGIWWGAAGCRAPQVHRSPPQQPSASQPPAIPPLQVETERLRVKWLEPGTPSQVIWEASVPRAAAESSRAGALGTFENVQCVLYQNGKPTTDLHAGRVQAIQEQWRIYASRGVRAYSRVNGVQLQAREVIWLARQNRLIARGDVQITGKQFSLRAPQVELDTALQVMRVTSP
ncbi:MAG: hypothetical protein RMM06_01110 [Armatimonadota bacterium]|nr:hypothetical protein [bacterium]MCS7308748.1 hypothetical protein [Armatimonadota bacterium]MDW8103502.1 hypothetical protein [Armatimonadota bacterium]MDW8289294.1 hypothetical protein [Armatimonadota bacterium]